MKTDSTLFQSRTVRSLALVVLGLSLAPVTAADSNFSDANWSSMGAFPGVNGQVFAAVVDSAGNLYIGGDLTIVGDVIVNGIAKWDGTKWSALGAGIGSVWALAASGIDVYAATLGSGQPATIAKWDGKNWSVLGSAVNENIESFSFVNALAVSGNDLYAGGEFTTVGGVAATNIAKWNGSTWSALGSGMGGIWRHRVSALAVLNGEVYAGGRFTTAGDVTAPNIAKWNGTSWSALGSGVDIDVTALAVSGSDLYVAGQFTMAGGVVATNIAKWNGTSWSALGSGMNSGVSALAASGSDLYVVSSFANASGIAASIAKWDGTNRVTLGSGMNGDVSALAVSGSELYASGGFTTAGGVAARNIAKWNGTSWSAVGSFRLDNADVEALAVSGSDVYAGGVFATAGDSAANRIAKWNGTNWSALGSGIAGPPPSGSIGVRALAISGGDVFAGGWFMNVSGIAASYVAKWDGSNWSALGSGVDGAVNALTVSGSDVYAGGWFTNAGGITANYIAKWNGSNWSALGSGIEGPPPRPPGYLVVYALTASGNDVYAGGIFRNAGGIAANYIAKWDGSSWSALGSGVGRTDGYSPGVTALAVSDTNVYAGGAFTTAGTHAATNIAKWDGTSWSPLGSGLGDPSSYVSELFVSGTDLYAGGYFTTADGRAVNHIAKWDGSNWSALGSGMNGPVNALAVSGNDLFVGGGFTMTGGKVSAFIARAYLLDLPALSVLRSGAGVRISWPSANTADFTLEQSTALRAPASWAANTAIVTDDGVKRSVTLSATNSPQFFRLRR